MREREIRIIGVPIDLGAGRRGVDMGPSGMRKAGLASQLAALGHRVVDEGNIPVDEPETQQVSNPKLRYLAEIARAEAAAVGLSTDECLSYLRENLYFYLGERERRGLELFRSHAAALHLISETSVR